jgi:hypothetical protein
MESETFIEEEKVLWKENPSHWTKVGYYIVSVILIPLFGIGLIMLLVVFLKLKYTIYTLTDQRIIIQTGIFSRSIESIELYRIKDIKLNASFTQRIVGIGNIMMVSSDKSTPSISLCGFSNPNIKFNQLRSSVETCRLKKGVKEFDQNDRII